MGKNHGSGSLWGLRTALISVKGELMSLNRSAQPGSILEVWRQVVSFGMGPEGFEKIVGCESLWRGRSPQGLSPIRKGIQRKGW